MHVKYRIPILNSWSAIIEAVNFITLSFIAFLTYTTTLSTTRSGLFMSTGCWLSKEMTRRLFTWMKQMTICSFGGNKDGARKEHVVQ